MTRVYCLVLCICVLALIPSPLALAQDDEKRPTELAPEEQKLSNEAKKLNQQALQSYQARRYSEAAADFQKALEIQQRLYPADKYPDGHAQIAEGLGNLGAVLQAIGQVEKALTYYEQSLQMKRTLYPRSKYPDGHESLATGLDNLGRVLEMAGQAERALSYHEESLAMRRKLYPVSSYPNGHLDLANSLNNLGRALLSMGQSEKALSYYRESLKILQSLFPASKYPGGHPEVARGLNNLGTALQTMGEAEKSLSCFEQALEMTRQLYPASKFPDGHPDIARCLNNIGFVLMAIGQSEQALSYYEQSLSIYRAMFPATKFPDGHPILASVLNNLAGAYLAAERLDKALTYYEQSLVIRQRFYPKSKYADGHPDLAQSLNNMGHVFAALGRKEQSLGYYEQALAIYRKLYPAPKYANGHPDLASCLNNVAHMHKVLGQQEKALGFYTQSLQMLRLQYPESIYPEGHYDLAVGLNNSGSALLMTAQPKQALQLLKEALTIQQKLLRRELVMVSESAALDLITKLRHETIDYYYSAAVQLPDTATDSYLPAWDNKGELQRLLSKRHLAAFVERQQSAEVRHGYEKLGQIQGEIGHLLNNPGKDVAARDQRLHELSDERNALERDLARQVPALERDNQLVRLTPADLIALLPSHAVFIDLVRYTHAGAGNAIDYRYLAFILTKGQPIRRIELGDSAPIDQAIAAWRRAIETQASSDAPARLSARVWEPLFKQLPPGTKTLYLAPDADLARMPWAALPIAKDRVLLEKYAIAQVPHGRFLLEQLKYPPKFETADSVLALGNVLYESTTWPELPSTVTEIAAVKRRAEGRPFVSLTVEMATAERLRATLPQARYVHLATHGFFDASKLQAEKKREADEIRAHQFGNNSRIKVAAKNPLGFVGLVLAKGEVLTGLSLVDLSLENITLVTLSACETGLGEYTGGEGVQGLQRAFHVAGCPNVVASLWKVNDAATAALMAKFYHELWENKKPPIEALRDAQLTIYRHPELIPDLAGERGAPKLNEALASQTTMPKPPASTPADTRLWAPFVLSGAGR